ncbi:MAG: carboxymuconolactone decarboxylase family protein [Magnetovibrionaceae bacterium]
MTTNYPELGRDMGAAIGELRKAIPDVAKGFSAMANAALKPGVLDTKTKELVAVGVAIAARCDGCIAFHVKGARDAGATREEIAETIASAVFMGGGPSLVYGSEALQAFDQFEALDAPKAAAE